MITIVHFGFMTYEQMFNLEVKFAPKAFSRTIKVLQRNGTTLFNVTWMPSTGLETPCGFCCLLVAKSLQGLLDVQLSAVKKTRQSQQLTLYSNYTNKNYVNYPIIMVAKSRAQKTGSARIKVAHENLMQATWAYA